MNICVFDTETTSLEKPFCYNIGYIIADEEGHALVKRDFVVEQIWHNLPLFSTAYYADKRQIYVSAMRSRQTIMDKFGHITQQMARDFNNYEVRHAYAYNSGFDERVFEFNCEWFKCINPFDNIEIHDIRGNAHQFICGEVFEKWCEDYGYYTESGNYSTTAETVFRFVSGDNEFDEAHTALNDSEIEGQILFASVECGAELGKDYKAKKSLERVIERELTITKNNKVIFSTDYTKIRISKDKTSIILK